MSKHKETRRAEATWCEWCDKVAQYEAEVLNGRSVDVCSMANNQHPPCGLTGRYRRIRRFQQEE